jgi:hypothetical protein
VCARECVWDRGEERETDDPVPETLRPVLSEDAYAAVCFEGCFDVSMWACVYV